MSRLVLLAGLVWIVAWLAAPRPFSLAPRTGITVAQAGAMLSGLRAVIGQQGATELPAAVRSRAGDRAPLVLTIWSGGRRQEVLQEDGATLEIAYVRLAERLRGIGRSIGHPTTRLQLDVAVGEGWVPQEGLLFSLSFVEGHDGVSGVINDRRVYLPPSELIRLKKYGTFHPLPGYDKKFVVGIDAERVVPSLQNQARRNGVGDGDVSELRRFRALTVVEGDDLTPRRLLKGTVERPALTRERLEQGVLAGADYLVRAIQADGTYRYQYNPVLDRDEEGVYNWPRHAGVSYSLALVGRLLDKPELVEAAGRALVRFEEQLVPGPDGTRCLKAKGKCYLGSSALGLLALAEYRIASGDGRFDGTSRQVAAFLESMQKDDGFFFHDWYPETGIDRELMKLYASQQAVLALARHAEAVGDDATLAAAERGMDYLAGPYWDHFLGAYFFGQEHWTCLAAEELYRTHPKREYAELCWNIGVHYDRICHNAGETPFDEDVGGMSLTHFFTPHLGGTATAAEAMVSAELLGKAEGLDVDGIRAQLVDTFGFLVKGQVTAHDRFWLRDAAFSLGGVFESQAKPRVRIDTVQHAISAMVRGLHLVPEGPEGDRDAAARDYRLQD